MTDKQVNRYAKICRLMKRLEEERERLKGELTEALERGEQCPRTSPFTINLVIQKRKNFNWKWCAEEIAKKFKATATLKRMQDEASTFEVKVLQVVANPDWGKAAAK